MATHTLRLLAGKGPQICQGCKMRPATSHPSFPSIIFRACLRTEMQQSISPDMHRKQGLDADHFEARQIVYVDANGRTCVQTTHEAMSMSDEIAQSRWGFSHHFAAQGGRLPGMLACLPACARKRSVPLLIFKDWWLVLVVCTGRPSLSLVSCFVFV